ncbi:Nucleolar protein 56 [Mitosporidium daphniae]
MHVLFETSSGYSLFETHNVEDIGKNLPEIQKEVLDISKFGKRITLTSFLPFKSAAHALENINSLAEGEVPETLESFLELALPKASKKSASSKSGILLGVSDKALAGSIKQTLGINCVSDDLVHELVRGIRCHLDKLLSQYIVSEDLKRSQLGLGHAFSGGKVAFNVNRSDNMIIQAIALCDQLDKDINLFSMRIKEWYSWHFPELSKIAQDNLQYAKLALLIRQRSNIQSDPSMFEKLLSIVNDTNLANMIVDASKISMGMEIAEADMVNINHFANKLVDLAEYRASLGNYLHNKMNVVAPNLAALIGDSVGARLISHAGSLTNLAKFPASTVQILGAEKALFRALKTRGKTPKYGLIFHSTFIGRAASKNKGRISRFLANKCSIASRLDSFSDTPDAAFGDALRQQVEQRLEFFDGGPTPLSNQEVMHKVMEKLNPIIATTMDMDIETEPSSKKRKQGSTDKSKKDSTKTKKEPKAEPIKEPKVDAKSSAKEKKALKVAEKPSVQNKEPASKKRDAKDKKEVVKEEKKPELKEDSSEKTKKVEAKLESKKKGRADEVNPASKSEKKDSQSSKKKNMELEPVSAPKSKKEQKDDGPPAPKKGKIEDSKPKKSKTDEDSKPKKSKTDEDSKPKKSKTDEDSKSKKDTVEDSKSRTRRGKKAQ